MTIQQHRRLIGISQVRLSRLAEISEYRLKQHEVGNATLTNEEVRRVTRTLAAEGVRLRQRIATAAGVELDAA